MDVRSHVVEASSSEALTQKERAVDAVMFQVLDNPSLREEILSHVIFGKDSVDRKVACTLRLVGKSWNESVVRILRKAHQHLFRLDRATRHEVERFVSTFASSTEVMGSVPPLAFHAFDFLCPPQNLESFSNCLIRCGGWLVQLGFKTTEDGHAFKYELQNLSLPCLHKLNITLDFCRCLSPHGQVAVVKNDNVSTFLLKSVLRASSSLSELSVNIMGLYPVTERRPQFTVLDSVILPPSIIKLTTCITGDTQRLEMLTRSPLPNLESLTMWVGKGSDLFSDGLIIRILDNCRKSLKNVRLVASSFSVQAGAHDVARFPVMEQLVELHLSGVNVEPELLRDSLDKYFPKLRTLRVLQQDNDVFQKLAASSPVPGVTSLRLFLRQNLEACLKAESMQVVNFVFPNLRKLAVTMSSEDSSGLEYIFREMRQLTELDIKVECNIERSFSGFWDALLTGVPLEVIARSRADPEFWEKNELEDENLACIKNLTELKKCSLTLGRVRWGGACIAGVDEQVRESPFPYISDFVFNYALLKMPKLMEFHLRGVSAYDVSKEMIEKWRNDGRFLTFN